MKKDKENKYKRRDRATYTEILDTIGHIFTLPGQRRGNSRICISDCDSIELLLCE